MTKRLKNILIGCFSVFAFLFAGVFFVGCCDVDYSKISLIADRGNIELDVGESSYVTVKIQGYQKGFSNRVKINSKTDGKTDVFTVTDTVYTSDDTIRFTVMGVAGGTGQLIVQTLEGNKSCPINVSVNQYTSYLSRANTTNYVSNQTDFVPNAACFIFDEQTTDRDLTHYYIKPEQDVDFSTLQLSRIDTVQNIAYFDNRSNGNVIYREIAVVDRFCLEEENGVNKLYRCYQNEKEEINLVGQFYFLSVYNHSVSQNQDGIAENILSCLSPIYVLPDIKCNVKGGYLVDDIAEFEENKGGTITIVPNNANKREYVLRIEMGANTKNDFSQIVFSLRKSNNYSVVDYFDYENPEDVGKDVRYIKISQNSQKKATTEFSMEVYYDIVQQAEDSSVRINLDWTIEIKIAPSTIYVNGTTDPPTMTLYNYYLSPEFGWQDLYIDVLSNYSTSPDFEGIYFNFETQYIDIMLNNTSVNSVETYHPGATTLYKDLSKPFQIRGSDSKATVQDTVVSIYVVSDVVENKDGLKPVEIHCKILDGADTISPYTEPQPNYYYLDIDGGTQTFSMHIYANKAFSYSTARCISSVGYSTDNIEDVDPSLTENSSAVDGVAIDTHPENPYIQQGDQYYINLSVTPRLTGIFTYTITLDNGISRNITFNCIRTLNTTVSPMRLTTNGNEDVSRWSYEREGNSTFDNVLNIEILNSSTKDAITFGSTADIEVTANVSADEVTFAPNDSQYISVAKNSTFYRITTKANGNTRITFTLTGYIVLNFERVTRTLTMYIDISSFSIVQEFYLQNGTNYALNNTVYFDDTSGGNLTSNSNSIEFQAVANRPESNNFVQYYFTDAFAKEIWDNPNVDITIEDGEEVSNPHIDRDGHYGFNITALNFEDLIGTRIVQEQYDKKFVYFYAFDQFGRIKDIVTTVITITWTKNPGTTLASSDSRTYKLSISSGLMFYADTLTVLVYDPGNPNIKTDEYKIEFTNQFSIGDWATFDTNTFTYKNVDPAIHTTILNANITQRLNQREITRRFDAQIVTKRYQTVKSISLASSLKELNFSSDNFEISLGVYTTPVDATNNDIRAYFVPTKDNKYQNMVLIEKSYLGNGYYTLDLSCEEFLKSVDDILEPGCSLTGMVYIYPTEWERLPNYSPIVLSVQFRNGSKENPYLLETAEDVLAINSSETMLRSHYEINSQIDMSSVKNATPIGIIDGKVIGFSGTITGTTSDAAITNLSVYKNENGSNFVTTIEGITYAGLFAQINTYSKGTKENADPIYTVLENFSVRGSVNLQLQEGTVSYVGLVTAVNQGQIINVMAEIASASSVQGGTIYFGALAAINYGRITQNIKIYETSNLDKNDVEQNPFYKLQSKNLAYYNVAVEIKAQNIYAGGVVGASSGVIERISPSENYKLYGYSGYTSYTLITVDGTGENISVGGIAGLIAYLQENSVIPMPELDILEEIEEINSWDGANFAASVVDNILVGGIITATGDNAAAGGIVGNSYIYSNTNTNYIYNSTDRTFIRGVVVGALVGKEVRGMEGGQGATTTFKNNKIEAVDAQYNAFDSAKIIKYSNDITGLPQKPEKTEEMDDETYNKNLEDYYKQVAKLVAIGESLGGSADDVTAVSYLDRTLITVKSTDVINPSANITTSSFYGDFILAQQNGNGFNIYGWALFEHKDVNISEILDASQEAFKMQIDEANAPDMYFMYHFSVSGRVDGSAGKQAQDDIDAGGLNTFNPNQTDLYPFVLKSQEVSIVASSSTVLSIDINGNITTKTTGDATITLSSILNTAKSKTIRIHVFNYFNKDAKSAMFYDTPDTSSTWLQGQTNLNIVGNSYANIYLIPSYEYSEKDADFRISYDGVLNFNNVNYFLDKNLDMTVDVKVKENTDTEDYSETEKHFESAVTSQTVIFWRKQNPNPDGTYGYVLTPEIRVSLKKGLNDFYNYYYSLADAKLEVKPQYFDAATYLSAKYHTNSLATNETFSDLVTVKSSNENEYLFYKVFKDGVLIQDRLPDLGENIQLTSEEDWKKYIAYEGNFEKNELFRDTRLFDITITRRSGANGEYFFDYTFKVNKKSTSFEEGEPSIYGKYTLRFYATEGESGVFDEVEIELKETVLKYVSANNYSNGINATKIDYIVVPSQKGMLEVNLNPIESTFETFKISNNVINNQTGSANATFALLYRTITSFVEVPNFGTMIDGTFSFTYQEFINFLHSLPENENAYPYLGKIYLSYYIPALNVEDGSPIAFDIEVKGSEEEPLTCPVELKIKLLNYATVHFADKQPVGDGYYVARGLGYDLELDYYGYNLDEISLSVDSEYITLVDNHDGTYRLNVTSGSVLYGDEDPGYRVTLTVNAERSIDNQKYLSQSEITIYIMDYVLNYTYQEGINEDIVRGMENGVISTAIGNPYKLEFNILDFIEYFDDPNNMDVIWRVNEFVEEMTNSVAWTVYENGKEPFVLQRNQPSPVSDYYFFDSTDFTITPSRLYNAESDIYHFSAGGFYTMSRGSYSVSTNPVTAMRIYTEFAFDVHNQSTQDSPIPVYNLEDFLGMEADAYYILMKNIKLPSSIDETQFTPITTQISGLDGNNKRIIFSGNYVFDGLEDVGVFTEIADNAVFKNVNITIEGSVTFKMNTTNFNIGLLAANNNGNVTNCQVLADVNGGTLSVDSSAVANGSNIAGLVAQNSGFITNSRTGVNINGNVNVAGFVASNTGLIASSYFMGATLNNTTDRDNTAGFVINNSGRIYTSYVSGGRQDNQIYYGFLNEGKLDLSSARNPKYLTSSYGVSGFVHTNTGTIEDCYSNIMLTGTPYAVGFVYQNSGLIERAFSTCLMDSEQTINYGFAQSNSATVGDVTTDGAGIIECFFLQEDGKINYNIADNLKGDNCQITPLTCKQFDLLDEENGMANLFENFAIARGRDINSVWFISNDTLDGRKDHFNGQNFVHNRLELVAPNIIATSQRVLSRMETVTENDVTYTLYIYNYVTTENASPLGDEYNPILIEDAETFENYIVQENNASNVNTSYYRLISDIDYSEYEGNGGTYNTKFVGYLEGNFMSVRGVVLHSANSLHSAGLFAELGDSKMSSLRGTLMNFTFAPRSVNFANANAVGAVVGKVDGGAIINVNVELYTNYSSNEDINANATVQGKNLVGGVVGVAVGDYIFNKIGSQFGARARQQIITDNNFDESVYDWSDYSFAGSVVGVLSGTGNVYNVQSDSRVVVAGAKAGLLFGSIGSGVTAQKITLNLLAEDSINGYNYSGLIAGESMGTAKNVQILGESVTFENVRRSPVMPISFGAFAGIVNGGSLSDITVNIREILLSSSTDENGITYVGGIAGVVIGQHVSMENITVTSTSLRAYKYAGGVAGIVGYANEIVGYGQLSQAAVNASFKGFNVDVSINIVGTKQDFVGIGGLTAKVAPLTTLEIAGVKTTAEETETTRKNTVSVNANAHVLLFGTTISVYLGGLIGYNESSNTHSIGDTDSTFISSSRIYVDDVTKDLTEYEDTTFAVQATGGLTVTGEKTEDIKDLINVASPNCTYKCQFVYRRYYMGANTNYRLYLSNYGSPQPIQTN